MLNRRTLLVALGTAAFALPNSFAQQHPGKAPRIGWLVPTTQAEWDGLLEQYRLGMRELGYIEGRTVETEYLYAMATSTVSPTLLRSWWSTKST